MTDYLVEPYLGTLEDSQSQWFYIPARLRLRGQAKLKKQGRYIEFRQRFDNFVTANIDALCKRSVSDIVRGSTRKLDTMIEDPNTVKERLNAAEESENTLSLMGELLVRGKIDVLKESLSPLKFGQNVGQLSVRGLIYYGIYYYVSGDYGKTKEISEKAMIRAKDSQNLWINCAARSANTLVRIFLGEKLDLAAEFAQALADAEGHCSLALQEGIYWRAMTHMQAGTAYWHLMRVSCPQLGGEKDLSEYQKSIEHYEAALRDFTLIDDKIFRAYASNSIGHLTRLSDDMEVSLKYYAQALPLSIENKNVRGQLGFAHGIAGWLGWLARSDESYRSKYISLMTIVESLYRTQWNTMIPPIRAEYDLFWSLYGGQPPIDKPGIVLNTKSALLKRAVTQAQNELKALQQKL